MRAPHNSTIKRAASRCAAIARSGCSCRSKRALASVRSPSFVDVRMMLGPFQVAASIATRVVASETSLAAPPMTPPIPVGPAASHTTTTWASSARSSPSSVTIRSPSRARRTSIAGPATRSRS
jgi:hypothetical protein